MKSIIVYLIGLITKIYLLRYHRLNFQVKQNYTQEREIISKLYKENLYWHGTGRYQYNSNYEDNEDKEKDLIDVLESIIKNQGILPLVKDPWMQTDKGFHYTISLATVRIYSTIYAMLFDVRQKTTVAYLLGARFYWSLVLVFLMFISSPIGFLESIYFQMKLGTKMLKKTQSRTRNLNEIRHFKIYLLQLSYTSFLRSDIQNNYPIIFAIKEKNVEVLEIKKGMSLYEVRTENKIKLEDISHIEVPISKVGVTRDLLNKYGISIPVLSIESAEIYMKLDQSFKEYILPEVKFS